ncbi:MAG: PKD domain-containing protein [Bacteroidales bacterium]|nr:PKD domain-containing protein [Bacteroidales bacterium]
MKNFLLVLLLVAANAVSGQNFDTVYVDPGYTGSENGTLSHPYNSWDDFNIENHTVYLQKRGTTTLGGIAISGRNHVKLGAYGSGDNPVLTNVPGTEANIIGISRCDYIEIADLTLIGDYPVSPTAGVQVYGHWSSGTTNNITIKNCDISHCYNGVRILPGVTDVETVTVTDCVIHHIEEDGVFAKDVDNFSCINTHIYHVNLDYFYQCSEPSCAAGDGIHLTGDCDNFLIENCVIDRRFTGFKFCFIHNSDGGGYGNDGVIRDCTFYPPKDTVGSISAGGALYLFDGDTLIIERSRIVGGERIYSNDAGTGGQISFDYVFMNYFLCDSVHNLQVSFRNEYTWVNNSVFTSNAPDELMVDLGGGEAIVKNSVFAAGPVTTPYYDINQIDSSRIYQGPSINWQNEFGWVDWGNGNYHLMPNSPLRDMGMHTGISLDLDNNAVPQGGATDIGVYEFQEGTTGLAPVAGFIATDSTIMVGESITFLDQSTNNPLTWSWSFEGGQPATSNNQNPTVQFPNAGIYSITLNVSNASGSDQITREGFIHVEASSLLPTVDFTVSYQHIEPGQTIVFTDQSQNNPTSWHWSFEGGVPPASPSSYQYVSYPEPGTYDVTLKVTNGYGSTEVTYHQYITVGDVENSPLNLKVFLEGPFRGQNMFTPIYTLGYIPDTQPYNSSPWNYSGNEQMTDFSSPLIIDWVLVEIRQSIAGPEYATEDSTVFSEAALLLKYGNIIGTDGEPLTMNVPGLNDSLYVVIHHRNHASIMSSIALQKAGDGFAYDFTTNPNLTYGGVYALKNIGGSWVMRAGDGNSDGLINNADKNDVLLPHYYETGYKRGDYNFDGMVNIFDYTNIWLSNIGKGIIIP